MSATLLILLIPMFLVPLGAKYLFDHQIVPWEIVANIVIGVLVVSGVYQLSRYSQMADTEFYNGAVTAKKRVWVSCSHSYKCRCRTVYSGSGKDRTSHTECDTCYDHSNDWDWRVYSTAGNFEISRIDRRGSYEPPRWTKVFVGEPVAIPHMYTNYVKGAPDSLFHKIAPNDAKKLPVYPEHYDYQYADRVIAADFKLADLALWNKALSWSNSRIGPQRQGNAVLVVTKSASNDYASRLENHWLGGKKNDIVVVVGAPNYPNISWVHVFSWSKQDMVNVQIRNDLLDSKVLEPGITTRIIEKNIMAYYQRRPMADFEYLADEVVPSTWALIIAFIIGMIASVGAARLFSQNDENMSNTAWRLK